MAVGSLYQLELTEICNSKIIDPSNIVDIVQALKLLIALLPLMNLPLWISLLDLMARGCRDLSSLDSSDHAPVQDILKLQQRLARGIIHHISISELNPVNTRLRVELVVRLATTMAAWAEVAETESKGTASRNMIAEGVSEATLITLSHQICDLIASRPPLWASPKQLWILLFSLRRARCEDSKLLVLRHRLQILVKDFSPAMAVSLLRAILDAGAVQHSEAEHISSVGAVSSRGRVGRRVVSSALMHGRMLGSMARLLRDKAEELTPREVSTDLMYED